MTQLPPRLAPLQADPLHPQLSAAQAPGLVAKAGEISRPASTAPRIAETPRNPVDALSDKATASFVRRTLCAHHIPGPNEKGGNSATPVEELLPPLTSSNAIDLQLYAIISVILKEFVYTWYAKITPDHVFVDEVIQIIAHCTRALEQRLRKVDLEALLLDEIPRLVDAHLTGAYFPFPFTISLFVR
jgi:PXA domain